jgi:type II restriction/modification system DNA methylase subunit YeeA
LQRLFEHATTFGSLIQVPEELAKKLPALKQLSEATSQDLFVSDALKRLGPLVQQAELLAAQYDAVVANPPYMGKKGMNALVKKFVKDHFPDAKSDLFGCFIDRGFTLAKSDGYNAMVTMQSWMFLSSFQKMRERMLREKTILTMAHFGPGGFAHASAMVVQTTAFVLKNQSPQQHFKPVFFRLLEGSENEKRTSLVSGEKRFDTTAQDEFKNIPGSPVAYWASEAIREVFAQGKLLEQVGDTRQGLSTSDNDRFLRQWFEVSLPRIGFTYRSRDGAQLSKKRWFPYNKGGIFRRWYGNRELIINWENDGEELREWAAYLNRVGTSMGRLVSQKYYFRSCITWSKVSGVSSFRAQPAGAIFDVAGTSLFLNQADSHSLLIGLLNTKVVTNCLKLLSPTLNFEAGHIGSIPLPARAQNLTRDCSLLVASLTKKARRDWDSFETSWDFNSLPILIASSEPTPTLESSYTAWTNQNRDTIAEMKRLEEENNRLFIDAYGLADELTPDVPIEQITLTVNPAYRYGGKLTEEEQWTRFRQDTMEELVSYAIGCTMGRYSLDAPGLIYAHSGNEGFDPSRYPTFPADGDGIVPLTDTEWFDDDAAHRLIKFISVAWDAAHLEDNLTFLADNLSPKKNESSRETLRRYLCDSFFKDHLQAYKKRPIYWLLSSGKQKAFQCLAYLHRYNEGTLSRMRTEYVIPLQGKITARIEQLSGDINAATSTAHRKKLERERDKLSKQQAELQTFDEKLRHYTDQRISLDLDDGVKVNYGKFGDLLAEVKAVTGKKPT